MTDLNPSFSISDFDDYGTTNLYLTAEQLNSVALTESRVNDQLDWLAQLLGWSGPEYWANLASTVSQKRNLLTGSFGVYDGYIHPEVVTITGGPDLLLGGLFVPFGGCVPRRHQLCPNLRRFGRAVLH
jgi:hypothetical protein